MKGVKSYISTRMHSSRMRTARTVTMGGGVLIAKTRKEIDNSDTIYSFIYSLCLVLRTYNT